MTASSAGAWIEKHLWAIAAAIMAIYGGYLTGQATTEMRMVRIEEKQALTNARIDKMDDALKDKLGARHDFMNDSAAVLNFICQDRAPCRDRFRPVRVPE